MAVFQITSLRVPYNNNNNILLFFVRIVIPKPSSLNSDEPGNFIRGKEGGSNSYLGGEWIDG